MPRDLELEKLFDKLNEFIEENDKDGMLRHIKEHKIKPSDYSEDLCSNYPLDRAAEFGQLDIFNTLVDLGYSIEGVEVHPIFHACTNGYLDLLTALVEIHGVDPTMRDPFGTTPLTCAVLDSLTDIVKYLVSAGASVNERSSTATDENVPILHHAVGSPDSSEVCKFLISKGADVRANDDQGNTALHKAANELVTDIIKILLDAGADVDATNSAGETPFFVASKALSGQPLESISSLRLLYSKGADPEVKDCNGETSLHYAMDSYKHAYFLLVEVNISDTLVSSKELFNLAFKAECKDTINLLVSLGHDPRQIESVYDDTDPWTKSEEGQEVMKKLREIASHPQNLADLCCFKIRHILGKTLSKVVDTFPVAETVKDFVKLSYLPQTMQDDEGEEDGDEEDDVVDDEEEEDDDDDDAEEKGDEADDDDGTEEIGGEEEENEDTSD